MITSTIQTITIIVIRPMPNPFLFFIIENSFIYINSFIHNFKSFCNYILSYKENKVYKIELDDMNDKK